MHAALRLILILTFAGVAATVLATLAARWLSEANRLARAFRRGLAARPDATLIAYGTGRGAALSLAAERIVTVWDGGGWRMDYPLAELLGAELDLDGDVAGRMMRGEPRRLVDRRGGTESGEVRLRLLFDHPTQPDFELMLWPSRAPRGGFGSAREAIAEANRWLARLEAVIRRAAPAPAVARPPPTRPAPAPDPAQIDLFDEDEPEDELTE